ncbi:alpha/beta fold hydrolase [Jeongeupella avenae]|uniref:Alpha/beta fold hydrolase n=2 Tax=Antarcticirhabdus aurantiaca TaxID=2606717 RepID=A0ACD4NNU8_9HYPH|nr:alpha/beta fold hydrolase [Antarcticirhabdus aurantiaca]WAJ28423.1 alpha/beta fold hydrolase [Jeongeuplla avenae]
MLATPQRSRTARGAAYREAGAGEAVVLVHGVGMRLEAWEPQVEALSATHRVIAVDMPGHGESAPLPSGSPLPRFVDWLGAVLDDLGLDAVNLAGHSMGALIAGGAAATLGPRIRRVALLNGVHRRSPEARAAVMGRAREIAGGAVDFEGPLRRWFGEGAEDEAAYRLTREWLAGVDPAGYATAYAAFASGDETYADAWPRVLCPALFVTGDGDPNSTPGMAETMAAAAPNGRAAIIRGHRHMVNLTAPEEVNRLLADWLAR